MAERAVVFGCQGESLVGIVHVPDAVSPEVGVVVVVGGPQYRVGSHRQFTLMARRMCDAGYPVMRFDYRGMGDSSGEPRTFESISDDFRAAMDAFVREVPSLRQVVAFGLCDAASALLMQPRDERLSGLVLANPWARSESLQAQVRVRHYYPARLLQKSFWRKFLSGQLRFREAFGSLVTSLAGAFATGPNRNGAQPPGFLTRMLDGASSFEGPVLLLMSGRDLTAKEFDLQIAQSGEWRGWANGPSVARLDMPFADHTFSTNEAFGTANEAVLTWLSEQFPVPARVT